MYYKITANNGMSNISKIYTKNVISCFNNNNELTNKSITNNIKEL